MKATTILDVAVIGGGLAVVAVCTFVLSVIPPRCPQPKEARP